MNRETDGPTAAFSEHRELLFSIVYNMLGEVADTEDVVQETWLAWAGADHSQIANPRAYLVRIAVNEALTRLRWLRTRRETYIGPWLPEPLVTDGDVAESAVRAESVSLALMVVLDTLTPLERAVFILHEVFGYPHPEIADMLERSPVAIRQLAHRARGHVQARRPRAVVDHEAVRAVTERFLAAATGGDLPALLELLAPDVALWTDSGGKRRAARRVVTGRDKVGRLIMSDSVNADLAELTLTEALVNGEPAFALYQGETLYAVGTIELTEDQQCVRGIYGVVNPDKLRRHHEQRPPVV